MVVPPPIIPPVPEVTPTPVTTSAGTASSTETETTPAVKVDPKTEDLLNEYKKKKEKTGEEGTLGATAEEVDSMTLSDDKSVRKALQDILDEHTALVEDGVTDGSDGRHEVPKPAIMDDMDMDEDRKEIVCREIETFRKRHSNEEKNEDRRPKKPREATRTNAINAFNASNTDVIRRTKEGRPDKSVRATSPTSIADKGRRSGAITSFTLANKLVDEEAEAIRKKLERKLRDKEESYQKRLKQWDVREKKKAAEYEHEKEHERKRQRELQVEAQRLREFFEDYDDDIEDPKYYRGSALAQRLKDRTLEESADERDRQKEIELLEASRQKLIEEGDLHAESIILKMEQEMHAHLHKRLDVNGDRIAPDEEPVKIEADEWPDNEPPTGSVGSDAPSVDAGSPPDGQVSSQQHTSQFQPSDFVAAPEESNDSLPRDSSNTFLFSMTAGENVVRKKAAAFVDEEHDEKPKKHTPSWLPPSALKGGATQQEDANSRSSKIISAEDKKVIIQRIIDAIPTGKKELFNYPIEWGVVDLNFINNRIKPWVDKKIISYIGEAEVTLSNFICDRLLAHQPPERILADIAMVLDEEAEVFVVKMWRLLIFGIAEKTAGLA